MNDQIDPATPASIHADDVRSHMPDGPNVGPSPQEHLAAQGLLQPPATQSAGMRTIEPTEAQLDDAIENSFPASDPIATTSQKSTGS